QALDLKCFLFLRKILQETRSGSGIFHRESKYGRTNQSFVNALELSTLNGNLRQVVTNNPQIDVFGTSLGTKRCHVTGGDTAIVSHNHRQSVTSSLVDFSDDRLLVFESNCHWFSPRFRRHYQQTHM